MYCPPHIDLLPSDPSSSDESNDIGSDSSDSNYLIKRRRGKHQKNDREIRMEALEFEGSLNPDDFVDLSYAIKQVFDFKSYSNENKSKVVFLKFKKYASL